jgi:CBS domain-containing protein
MGIKITVQKDYLRTEASIFPHTPVSDVDELLRATKTNGKLVVLYNEGHVQGINIEQNTKLSDTKSAEVRAIVDVADKNL